jgi:glutamate dehydrogenase
VSGGLDQYLSPEAQRIRDAAVLKMTSEGVPESVARNVANLPALSSAADIVLIADRTGYAVGQVAAIYFAAEAHFQIDRIVAAARDIKVEDYFDRLAFDRGFDAMGDALRRLVAEMTAAGGSGAEAVAVFVGRKGSGADRVREAVLEMVASGLSLSKLTVVASMLGDLARS